MIDSLIFFLNNGYMPWYNVVKNFNDWETEILHSFSQKEWELLIEELRIDRTSNKSVIKRLVMQFSDSFLEKILFQLHNALNKNAIDALVERFGRVADITKRSTYHSFWEQAITVALNATNENDFTIELIKKLNEVIEFKENKEGAELKENKNKRKDESVDEEFFTENCGIVILHPFLLMYFQELGLLQDNGFINTEMQYRAVLLLYYLSTGQTQAPEYNLLLEKLLCAVDFDEPIPNYIELTGKEKEESANLLKSVTQHWKPLNGTSAEGLQSSFFQREGKLIKKENGWVLPVEQKTIDILLDKLPWGIGTVKLPWMKEILNVEWF
ncbi:MAG: contractile injection system tape measure protein [Ferruginibacter sp.]